jgi:DNA-binding transcriptional MerR regulator
MRAVTGDATLKVGEIARRAGVSVPTVHFYLREGLLPPAPKKTSRNMAYYDESYVARIRLIRRLQDERRLPLRVIRALLTEAGEASDGDGLLEVVLAEARALPSLELSARGATLERAALVTRTGVDPLELDELEALGLIAPKGAGKRARYGGDDVGIVSAVSRVRALGFSRELFPTSDLVLYQRAMSALVGHEARLFARRVRSTEHGLGDRLEAVIATLGELLAHMRRRLIHDLLEGLRGEPARPERPDGAAGAEGAELARPREPTPAKPTPPKPTQAKPTPPKPKAAKPAKPLETEPGAARRARSPRASSRSRP